MAKLDENRMGMDLAQLDKRLREIEAGSPASVGEIRELRRRLDAIAGDGQAGAAPGPGGSGDGEWRGGPAEDDRGPRAYGGLRQPRPAESGPYVPPRPPEGPSPRADRPLTESLVGRYAVSALAAFLVLMAAVVAIGSAWSDMPDGVRLAVAMGGGSLMACAGEYMLLARKSGMDGFWTGVAGCGLSLVLVSIAVGYAGWGLYGSGPATAMLSAWVLCGFFLSWKNSSKLFYAVTYVGGWAAMCLCPGQDWGARLDIAWQAAACAIPVAVLGVGLYRAFEEDDPFLWFLNAAFAGTAARALPYVSYAGVSVLGLARAALATVALVCAQMLFRGDVPGMRAMRGLSTFAACVLMASSFTGAFGAEAGAGLTVAVSLLVFVLTGMQEPMALGAAPVLGACTASLCSVAGPLGGMLAGLAAAVALCWDYGMRTKAGEWAVFLYSATALLEGMALAGGDGRWDAEPYGMAACLFGTCVAVAAGYASRHGRHGADPGGNWRLAVALGGGALAASEAGQLMEVGWSGPADAVYVVVLAAVACLLAFHRYAMGKHGGKGPALRAGCGLFAWWLVCLGSLADLFSGTFADPLAAGATAALTVAIPAACLALGFKEGRTGWTVQAGIAWCDAGVLCATGHTFGSGALSVCLLAMTVFSGAVTAAGFALGRKDVRRCGLALTIAHVLAVAAAAVGSGSGTAAWTLLGAGCVCFAVSFAYNRLAEKLDTEPDDGDKEDGDGR